MNADCHIHMVLDGVDWKAAIARHFNGPDLTYIRNCLDAYRKRGITYLRDGGDRWGVGAAARTIALDYGIEYKTPMAPLCKVGHYGGFIGEAWHDLKEYAVMVQNHRANGADFIKVMISGLMDFNQFGVLTSQALSDEEINELVFIAHEEGLSVMAHCNGARTAHAAALAGVDSIEHGAYLDTDALCAMKEAETVWVPTVSTVGNLRGKGRFDEYAVCAILDSIMENVEQFAAIGGMIAPGTDAGAWAVPHGCDTEYALLNLALGEKTPEILNNGTKMIQQKF